MTRRNKLFRFVLFVFLNYAFFTSSGTSGNVWRQMALIWSMGDSGVLHIDAHKDITVDKAQVNEHYYVAGETGTSLAGVSFYILYKKLLSALGLSPEPYRGNSTYVVRLLLISFSTAIFLFAMHDFLLYLPVPRHAAFSLVAVYALASPAFVYSTLLYRHQLSAVLCFFVFYLVFIMKQRGFKNHRIFLTGLLTSLGFVCDYASLITFFLLFLYLLINVDVFKRVFYYFLGLAPFATWFLGYNYVCFGNVFATGFTYSPMAPPEIQGHNIFQFFLYFWKPNLEGSYGITFSPYRGLFYYFPLALIPLIGALEYKKFAKLKQEIIFLFGVIFVHGYFVSTLGDWEGALGSVSRHLVLVIPFLIPLIGLVYEKYRMLFRVFALYSFLISLMVVLSPSGEAPFEVSYPMSFFLESERHGFFRENILTRMGLPVVTSVCIYLCVLFGGLFWFARTLSQLSPDEKLHDVL